MNELRYLLTKPVKITIELYQAVILLDILGNWTRELYEKIPNHFTFLCIELEEDLREKWCDRTGQIKVNYKNKTALRPTKWLVLREIISREIESKKNPHESYLIALCMVIEDILIGK